jgi:protein TonB
VTPLLRLGASSLLGLAVTGTMFWLLWALIHLREEFEQPGRAARIEFTRLRRDTEIEAARRQKPVREGPALAPAIPRLATTSLVRGAQPVQVLLPELDPRAGFERLEIGLGGSDRDVIPLVRINPDYPPRAQSRGIEGWVLVQFTISPAGAVRDATVIDAEPKGYFEQAALTAIGRWKYNPKIEGGVPVERRGIRVVVRFELEE